MSTDPSSTEARVKLVEEHVQAEVERDLDKIMATWGERPDFDDVPWDEQFSGRDGIREHIKVAVLLLGPGTILSAILIGVAAFFLLGVSGPEAAILGAALASTDPVMMRTVIRRSRTPPAARTARKRLARAKTPPIEGNALPQLLAELDQLLGAESRQHAPRAVSAYPDRAPTGAPEY